MTGEARDVAGVVNGFVDEVQVEGAGALDQGQEPPLVERENVEAEDPQPQEACQGPGLGVGGASGVVGGGSDVAGPISGGP